nr:metallopeptidase TldD-related protein [Gemmatimonadaceae bacterium]
LDVQATSQRAIDVALRSRRPVAIEPGRYTVVLQPQAVGDLVSLLPRYFQARAADEGRSPFSKRGGGTRVGEAVVSPLVTLASDPADAAVQATPFDGDGLPLARQAWIDQGVLRQLQYSRAWAAKQGTQPTGGASSLLLRGGTQTTEQLIAGTARGILVTRLWYLREVDPRTALHTGLTRDGTFLIENGTVTKSIKNMRFNESPLFLFANVEGLGPARRIGHAAAQGAGLQLHVAVGRGVVRGWRGTGARVARVVGGAALLALWAGPRSRGAARLNCRGAARRVQEFGSSGEGHVSAAYARRRSRIPARRRHVQGDGGAWHRRFS